jgi:molybdenum cofactor sulfurtransferase
LELKYPNGNPLVKIFGPSNFDQRGGNIILNFFDDQRNLIPFASIENLANERTISIRSGCFCNPGIDEANNCISQEEMSNYFASKTTGDYYDLIAFTGKIRGAIRVSVGIATNHADLDRFVEFAKSILELEIKKAEKMENVK